MDFRERLLFLWIQNFWFGLICVLVDCDMCTLCSILYDSLLLILLFFAFPINNKCNERIMNIECIIVVSFYYEMNTVIVMNFDTIINITPHSSMLQDALLL